MVLQVFVMMVEGLGVTFTFLHFACGPNPTEDVWLDEVTSVQGFCMDIGAWRNCKIF